jgi:hypothetical protein
MKPEETSREKKQTLYAHHKGKRNSVTIIGYIGSACGIVTDAYTNIGITVTANRARPEFGGDHEECVDECRVVPVIACEVILFENLLRLYPPVWIILVLHAELAIVRTSCQRP